MDPDVIRAELEDTLRALNLQIEEIRRDAQRMGVDPHQLKTPTGSWIMPGILSAKAQVLYALALVGFREEDPDVPQ